MIAMGRYVKKSFTVRKAFDKERKKLYIVLDSLLRLLENLQSQYKRKMEELRNVNKSRKRESRGLLFQHISMFQIFLHLLLPSIHMRLNRNIKMTKNSQKSTKDKKQKPLIREIIDKRFIVKIRFVGIVEISFIRSWRRNFCRTINGDDNVLFCHLFYF